MEEAWTSPRHFPDHSDIRQRQRSLQSCLSGECPEGQGFGSASCSHHPRHSVLPGSHQLREADVTCGTTKLTSPKFQPGDSQGCVPLAQIPWVDPSSPAAGEAAEPEVALINVLLGVFK